MADGTTVGLAYLNVVPRMDGSSALAGSAAAMGSSVGATMATGMKGSFSAGTVALGGIIASLGMQAAQAIGGFFTDSIEAGRNFDTAMAQVAATMGVTTAEVQDLRDFALEMGSTTAFSATEAAEALNYMALAGYDSEKAMAMLPNVLNLAAAGNMDLARASDMVTDASSALGLSTEQTTVMVDQMAQAASKSNTSVEQLGEAMLTVGGTAKVVKGGTQEISTALGVLADNGIKGSEGGTALRNVILSLTAPTDKAAEAMEGLGLNVFDAEGQMRPMNEILGDMSGLLSGMNEQERANWISTVFNKRDLKSVEALLAATTTNAETGTIRWNELSVAIGDAAGAAQQMAETQLDNLEGDTIKFQSALEGLQIRLYEGVEPALRAVTQGATDMISGISAALSGESGGLSTLINDAKAGLELIMPILQDWGARLQEIGEVLGGAIQEGMNYLRDWAAEHKDDIEFIAGQVQDIGGGVLDAIKLGIEGIQGALEVSEPLLRWLGDDGLTAIKIALEGISWAIDTLVANMQIVAAAIESARTGSIEPLADAIKNKATMELEHMNASAGIVATGMEAHARQINEAMQGTARETDTMANDVIGRFNEMNSVSGSLFDGMTKSAETNVRDTLTQFNGLGSKISDAAGKPRDIVPTVSMETIWAGNSYVSIPNIRWYATGGWVDDPTVLNVAGERGGEFVWPSYGPYLNKYADALASRMGGGGVTITGNEFVVRNDYDIERIGRELVRQWTMEERRSA